MAVIQENYLQFFTAVCYNWLPLLAPEKCKKIMLDSLAYRVRTRQVAVGAFVIMPNHLHFIWRVGAGLDRVAIQRDYLKITAKKLIEYWEKISPEMLSAITVRKKDRKIQVWKRDSLSVNLHSEKFVRQKLNYIHNNPCQPHWDLVAHPLDYNYSSARFYENQQDDFQLLTHYDDI